MKQKLIPFILFFIAITVSAQDVVYDFDSEIEVKKKEKLVESPYSMFGDNTAVLQTKHEDEKDHTLKIPITENERQEGLFRIIPKSCGICILSINFSQSINKEIYISYSS